MKSKKKASKKKAKSKNKKKVSKNTKTNSPQKDYLGDLIDEIKNPHAGSSFQSFTDEQCSCTPEKGCLDVIEQPGFVLKQDFDRPSWDEDLKPVKLTFWQKFKQFFGF